MTDKERLDGLREFLTDLKDGIADVMAEISDEGNDDDVVPIEKATRFMDYSNFLLVIIHCLEIIDDVDYRVDEMVQMIGEILGEEDDE